MAATKIVTLTFGINSSIFRCDDSKYVSPFLGGAFKLELPLSKKKTTFAYSHSNTCIVVVSSDVVKGKNLKSSSSNLLITKEEGLELYEDMKLGRSFEDTLSNDLQRWYEIMFV